MGDVRSAEIPLRIAIKRHRNELAGDDLSDQERGQVQGDVAHLEGILERTRERWGGEDD